MTIAMKETTFAESFRIQRRVIGALICRDFIALYGRNGLGFLVLFVEPLVIIGGIIAISTFLRLRQQHGFPVTAFVVTGWGNLWLFRYPLNKLIGVVAINSSFLYHRNVKVMDIILARSIMMIGATVAALILIYIVAFSISPMPMNDVYYFYLAIVLMVWYLFISCIFSGLLSTYLVLGDRLSLLFSLSMIIMTCPFVMVDWIPVVARKYVLAIPFVHLTEMLRYGMFGNIVKCYFYVDYVVFFGIIFTFFVVLFYSYISKRKNINALS